jgi:hypothetical protein
MLTETVTGFVPVLREKRNNFASEAFICASKMCPLIIHPEALDLQVILKGFGGEKERENRGF